MKYSLDEAAKKVADLNSRQEGNEEPCFRMYVVPESKLAFVGKREERMFLLATNEKDEEKLFCKVLENASLQDSILVACTQGGIEYLLEAFPEADYFLQTQLGGSGTVKLEPKSGSGWESKFLGTIEIHYPSPHDFYSANDDMSLPSALWRLIDERLEKNVFSDLVWSAHSNGQLPRCLTDFHSECRRVEIFEVENTTGKWSDKEYTEELKKTWSLMRKIYKLALEEGRPTPHIFVKPYKVNLELGNTLDELLPATEDNFFQTYLQIANVGVDHKWHDMEEPCFLFPICRSKKKGLLQASRPEGEWVVRWYSAEELFSEVFGDDWRPRVLLIPSKQTNNSIRTTTIPQQDGK